MLTLKIHPDPFLRVSTSKVDIFDCELKIFLHNMLESMITYDGVGLAANQVGDLRKIFVIHKDVAHSSEHKIFINPEIVYYSEEKRLCLEGCLSLPKQTFKVVRSHCVKIYAQDEKGETFNLNAFGTYAQAIQHEIDHLNNILLIDKAL